MGLGKGAAGTMGALEKALESTGTENEPNKKTERSAEKESNKETEKPKPKLSKSSFRDLVEKGEYVPVNYFIPKHLQTELRILKARTEKDMSEMVTEAIQRYLKSEAV